MTRHLLDLLEDGGARGTFFVLDDMAKLAPELMREIARRGHELASHGHRHRPLREETPQGLATGLAAAKARLEDLTGAAVLGFRAPFFSLTPDVPWVPELLGRLGFAYSSSVLPARSPLHGWPGAPRQPFLWPGGLLELPCPVARTGPFTMPFLGGMYLRYLPPWRLRWMAQSWTRGPARGLWSYCHPYDLDRGEPFSTAAQAGWLTGLMLWLNRGTTGPRLAALLHGRRSESFATRLDALRQGAPAWSPATQPRVGGRLGRIAAIWAG